MRWLDQMSDFSEISLVGRESELLQLANSASPITLLIGDSGVGKSALLAQAQLARVDAVCPPPVRIKGLPGGLQNALLEALVGAIEKLSISTTMTHDIVNVVVAASKGIAKEHLKDLGAAVGGVVLDMILDRLGPTVKDLVHKGYKQLSKIRDSSLIDRVKNSSDPDVIEIVVELASELNDLIEGRQVILALDDAETLTPDDCLRLAYLAESLPDGILIRVAFSTWNITLIQKANDVFTENMSRIELRGLGLESIRLWLQRENLPAEHAEELQLASNGYPLHVADAIELLHQGQPVSVIARYNPAEILRVRTQSIWQRLGDREKLAISMLAVFPVPQTSSLIEQYLGLEPLAWAILRGSLCDSGIFVRSDHPWFHELRRRCVWNEILEEDQQAESARLAREFLGTVVSFGTAPEDVQTYAEIARFDRNLMERNLQAAAVYSATSSELAVLGALLELTEHFNTRGALEVGNVLNHARTEFAIVSDLEVALELLANKGILIVDESDQETVVQANWHDPEIEIMIAGRCASELQRIPIPSLASYLFGVSLKQVLGRFRTVQYGIGRPSISSLSKIAKSYADNARYSSSGETRILHYLIAKLEFGNTPLYLVAEYDDFAERDHVIGILNRFSETIWKKELRPTYVNRHPMEKIPSERFQLAAQNLEAIDTAIEHPQQENHSSSAFDRLMNERTLLLSCLRELASPQERHALDLESSIGFLFDGDMGYNIVCKVSSGRNARRVPGLLQIDPGSVFRGLHIERIAGIIEKEYVRDIVIRMGTNVQDPLQYALKFVKRAANEFNKTQNRVKIAFESNTLISRIEDSIQSSQDDANSIASTLPVRYKLLNKKPERLYICTWKDTIRDGFVPSSSYFSVTTEIESPPYDDIVKLYIADLPFNGISRGSISDFRELGEELFGVSGASITCWSDGNFESFLGEKLGYQFDEVQIVYPEV
ncbi:hypothetical protein AB0A73_26030 [Glycomyces sp. NPDC047369]